MAKKEAAVAKSMTACALGEINLGMRLESILTPASKMAMVFRLQLRKMRSLKTKLAKCGSARGSALPSDGALQRTVECGLGLLVFLWRELSLQPLTFELEQFFLERV